MTYLRANVIILQSADDGEFAEVYKFHFLIVFACLKLLRSLDVFPRITFLFQRAREDFTNFIVLTYTFVPYSMP
jgi:hypothetical protein